MRSLLFCTYEWIRSPQLISARIWKFSRPDSKPELIPHSLLTMSCEQRWKNISQDEDYLYLALLVIVVEVWKVKTDEGHNVRAAGSHLFNKKKR